MVTEIVNFEVIFGYHGNQVAKSTSSNTPSHRTKRMGQFDMSLVFLYCIIRKIRPKYSYFPNSLILGGCHGNQAIQLSSPCLPWAQHPNSERASCKLFPFQKKLSFTPFPLVWRPPLAITCTAVEGRGQRNPINGKMACMTLLHNFLT